VWTAPEPVPVLGDPHRLHQVVFNLLDNAVKFTAPDGVIDVRVERGRTHGAVRVRDSGVGIPASALETIFEPFVQERPAARSGGAGLGLGLTVVRDLVHQHGGTVEARSAGAGQGSEFVISLPLGPDPETAVAPQAGAPDAAPDARRVLVVEDNADGRETLRLMLAGHGHVVELAEDGQGGIARALSFRPDVALIDIGLPDVSGHAVARAIRQQPGGDRVYLVALTGFGQPEDRQRAREAGFDAYLVKPVDPGTLAGVLSGRQPSTA
jgi:CheY-like chemotaxis protein